MIEAGDGRAPLEGPELARRYRVGRPDVADERIAEEVVVIHFGTGTYHGIRGGGVAVWQLLDAGLSLAELLAELAVRHSGVDAEAARAVLAFVVALERQQLIVSEAEPRSVGAAAASPAAIGAASAGPRLAFASPELETRDDLRDFLVLDPIHDVDERGWPHALPDATTDPSLRP
jgi:hypothetical protein